MDLRLNPTGYNPPGENSPGRPSPTSTCRSLLQSNTRKTPNSDAIRNYFEDNLVGKETRNSTRRKSRFNMDMRNIYLRTNGDLPSSNKALE